MGPSSTCRPTVAQKAPTPRARDCKVLRPAASFAYCVSHHHNGLVEAWLSKANQRAKTASHDRTTRPQLVQAWSPATRINRAKQNRISVSYATRCIVRGFPAERQPVHICMHYEESHCSGELLALKVLLMALKICLVYYSLRSQSNDQEASAEAVESCSLARFGVSIYLASSTTLSVQQDAYKAASFPNTGEE